MTQAERALAAYETVTGWTHAQVLHYAECRYCYPSVGMCEVGSCGCTSEPDFCDEYHEYIPWEERDNSQRDVA